MILDYILIFRWLKGNCTNFNPFLQNSQFHALQNSERWSITNSLTFYQKPSFKWKLNDGKKKDPRNIVISSIILSPSKLTDKKNRVEKKCGCCENLFDTVQQKTLFRNVDLPLSIVGTKLFQSGFKCLTRIRTSYGFHARKIIFYYIYFSPFFFFFSLDSG